jgi:hypothetical protein
MGAFIVVGALIVGVEYGLPPGPGKSRCKELLQLELACD